MVTFCLLLRGVGQWPHEGGRFSARLTFTGEGVRAPDLFSRYWSIIWVGFLKAPADIKACWRHSREQIPIGTERGCVVERRAGRNEGVFCDTRPSEAYRRRPRSGELPARNGTAARSDPAYCGGVWGSSPTKKGALAPD